MAILFTGRWINLFSIRNKIKVALIIRWKELNLNGITTKLRIPIREKGHNTNQIFIETYYCENHGEKI